MHLLAAHDELRRRLALPDIHPIPGLIDAAVVPLHRVGIANDEPQPWVVALQIAKRSSDDLCHSRLVIVSQRDARELDTLSLSETVGAPDCARRATAEDDDSDELVVFPRAANE